MTEHMIGVDISQFQLDAFDLKRNEARQSENPGQVVHALQKWLGALAVARILYVAKRMWWMLTL